jgi:hypothetical protein
MIGTWTNDWLLSALYSLEKLVEWKHRADQPAGQRGQLSIH